MGCRLLTRNHVSDVVRLLLTAFVLTTLFTTVCTASVDEYLMRGELRVPADHPPPEQQQRHHRRHKLYNECTAHFMRLRPRGERRAPLLDAMGVREDPNTDFIFKSTYIGQLTIQSAVTKAYLCFNRRGRLMTKPRGRKNPMCRFKEEVNEHHYSQYRSVGNDTFYLGFKPKGGRPLKGPQWLTKPRKFARCRSFLPGDTRPLDPSQSTDTSRDFQPGFKFNSGTGHHRRRHARHRGKT